jgi:hypothetical protein
MIAEAAPVASMFASTGDHDRGIGGKELQTRRAAELQPLYLHDARWSIQD